jgi:hypothetical protein
MVLVAAAAQARRIDPVVRIRVLIGIGAEVLEKGFCVMLEIKTAVREGC